MAWKTENESARAAVNNNKGMTYWRCQRQRIGNRNSNRTRLLLQIHESLPTPRLNVIPIIGLAGCAAKWIFIAKSSELKEHAHRDEI